MFVAEIVARVIILIAADAVNSIIAYFAIIGAGYY